MPSTSSGATTMPAPVSRISCGGGAVGRDDGEDRPLCRQVLEHLPREHAAPAAAGLGDQQQERLRVALQLERRAGAAPAAAARAGRRGRARRPIRGRSSGSRRANRTTTSSSPELLQRRRNGRGSRLPKNEPACVIRKRSEGRRSSPAKSSKSAAVRDRDDARRTAARSRISSAMASETQDDRVGQARRRAARPRLLSCSFVRTSATLAAPVRVRDERVAQVGDPGGAGGTLHRGTDQVHGRRRRGGQDDVDPLAPDDADRGRDRGERSRGRSRRARAGGGPTSGSLLRRPARGPASPCSSSRGSTSLRPEEARRGAPTPGVGSCSSSSRWIHFGSSGASTWVSIPSAGRCVANLSGRWTPPPPAGREVAA